MHSPTNGIRVHWTVWLFWMWHEGWYQARLVSPGAYGMTSCLSNAFCIEGTRSVAVCTTSGRDLEPFMMLDPVRPGSDNLFVSSRRAAWSWPSAVGSRKRHVYNTVYTRRQSIPVNSQDKHSRSKEEVVAEEIAHEHLAWTPEPGVLSVRSAVARKVSWEGSAWCVCVGATDLRSFERQQLCLVHTFERTTTNGLLTLMDNLVGDVLDWQEHRVSACVAGAYVRCLNRETASQFPSTVCSSLWRISGVHLYVFARSYVCLSVVPNNNFTLYTGVPRMDTCSLTSLLTQLIAEGVISPALGYELYLPLPVGECRYLA